MSETMMELFILYLMQQIAAAECLEGRIDDREYFDIFHKAGLHIALINSTHTSTLHIYNANKAYVNAGQIADITRLYARKGR